MSRVVGDGAAALRKMDQMVRLVEALSDVPRRTSVLAAPGINKLVMQQFKDGTDPYGRKWAPLKPATLRTGRRPPPLTGFTRQLRDGTGVKPRAGNRAGLVLVVGADYARFHQMGTRYMAARRILPQFGMPRAWRDVLMAASRQAAQSIAKGGERE